MGGTVLVSEFVEESTDDHCRLRRELLSSGSLPAPPTGFSDSSAGFSDAAADHMLHCLDQRGLAVLQLADPLTNDAFRRLGALLGTAIPETDAAVQRYVEDGVILHLVAEEGRTSDVSLQPFATTPLSLHSEGSGRAARDQPRYIVLMGCDPGTDTSATTVLVPMAAVGSRLSDEDLRLLTSTRYEGRSGVPTVARREEGRIVYSFRDFQGSPLRWVCDASGADETAVNQAFRRLLAGMYSPEEAYGVRWTRGLLVVIDNTSFFHGRSRGPERPAGRPRHLKRLRIR